ncbi:Major facilitator superfamily domain general substrate transporter [Lasiodiplodia theobromae]|uniref:General alpha-glucoside permease n=1 Tax=Lasiodiplodia theobromae TaxID=45133 RepID=A0A5N5DHG5_9PEZI|nr:MFS transporter [Lasiodiplodia theobromae]KAB2577010.1 General alpha-glucoside permease [Lasiodiplodia theobromae]KAF4543541.1 MFS transporter [Lasiodiplodia theobromae]KAF9631271.1 Major facilitator superfamily domain general substrate transporter [Lasiodiplodia theobromae]
MPTGALPSAGPGTPPLAAPWAGTPSIKGSSESARMAYLTASLIGIQFTWGIEMTYCTPYLLALGLAKSTVSLVWIAGPLSGLVMQPIVGIIADRSKSRWGRRRPFMVGGAFVVSLALLAMGWATEIAAFFIAEGETRKNATVVLAVACIYVIDFAINAVQASSRSLIVDTLPIPKQQIGSAWASRMVAVGALVGYAAGAIDLGSIFGTLIGDSQFKQLTVVAAVVLCLCVGITSWAVQEKVLQDDGKEPESIGAIDIFTQILKTATNLPPRIAAICWVQFWAWIGWFPFLFYSTTWVGEIWIRYDAPVDARSSEDTLGQIGRVGSLSLIVFSIITFVGSIVLPWLVKKPDDEKPEFTPRPPAGLASVVEQVEKNKPSLLTAWTLSHLVFTFSMLLAPFADSFRFATTIVAICGIPWAITCWAPFTFMGVEINRLGSSASANGYRRVSNSAIEMGSTGAHGEARVESGEVSGVYLGILNLYTTLPQFVGTFISWAVFSLLEPGKSPELAKEAHPAETHPTDGPNAIAVCLFIGALSAAGAAYATSRLRYIE